ncbi:MAG: F0F1 ATP synthase subunit A [Bifidobacteriaceae bacterium]|jgi:F-type H+-transporting ATPase subunit a|nr:F0F1 ATP synthase subunit A [Bifidobacteriaceae bacterium]
MRLALLPLLAQSSEGGMEVPSLDELFPAPFAFAGSNFFELNRLSLVRLIAGALIVVLMLLGARASRLLPGRGGNIFELAMGFVHKQIAVEILGEQAGRRYLPLLATLFFTVLGMNITGVIPLLNVASTSLVAMPLLMALTAFVAFNVAGIKAHGAGGFYKSALFPKGAPKFIYIILTPIELLSTFVLRPVTLTIRLMANMISGHFLLAAFFTMTNYLLVSATGALKPLAVLPFAAAFAFTLFEIFVAALQAYIFTLLTAVYISLSKEAH